MCIGLLLLFYKAYAESAKEQKSAQRALRKMERADYKSERNLMKAGQGGAQPSPTGFTNGSSPFGAAAAMSTYESSPHLTVVPPPLPPGLFCWFLGTGMYCASKPRS